jgi:glyoxylase-like metal-dependent hydrolase (beta-lactamase superfamily II)
MAKQVDAETLRGWLEAQQPVTVLDIRTVEDRGQWAIPGSVHLNAYDALRAGEAGPLADMSFPPDQPVVTVCKQQRVRFPYRAIADGEQIGIGGATITALHTPGHTLESTSYLLNDQAVFTGDTLFTKGVGRPDLHADPAGARESARAVCVTVATQGAGPEVVVLPAHASEPIAFDRRAVSARMQNLAMWLSESFATSVRGQEG